MLPFAIIQLPALPVPLDVIYSAVSLLIGLAVVIESQVLMRYQGKMPANTAFVLMSLLTSLWALVSCAAWYFLDFGRIGVAVAVVYPLYSILGLIYSTRLLSQMELPDDPMDVLLPAPYLKFCQAFGIVYTGLCMVALAEAFHMLVI